MKILSISQLSTESTRNKQEILYILSEFLFTLDKTPEHCNLSRIRDSLIKREVDGNKSSSNSSSRSKAKNIDDGHSKQGKEKTRNTRANGAIHKNKKRKTEEISHENKYRRIKSDCNTLRNDHKVLYSEKRTNIVPKNECNEVSSKNEHSESGKKSKQKNLDRKWQERYQELVQFYKTNNHSNFPARSRSNNKSLSIWVGNQRLLKKNNKLSVSRIKALEDINFVWDRRVVQFDDIWKNHYKNLVHFHKEHGHSNVPSIFPSNESLSLWVTKQRQKKRQNLLKSDRIKDLEKINFLWERPRHQRKNKSDKTWQGFYQELVTYFNVTGDPNVPHPFSSNKKLGIWVRNQRKTKGSLSLECIAKLNQVNFVWDQSQSSKKKDLKTVKKSLQTNMPKDKSKSKYSNDGESKLLSTSNSNFIDRPKQDYIKESCCVNPKKSNLEEKELDQTNHGHSLNAQEFSSNDYIKPASSINNQTDSNEDRQSIIFDDSSHNVHDFERGIKRKARPTCSKQKYAWQEQYKKLLLFYEKFGHSDIPKNNPLYVWICEQKHLLKNNKLKKYQIKSLRKIDSVLPPCETGKNISRPEKNDDDRSKNNQNPVKHVNQRKSSYDPSAFPSNNSRSICVRGQSTDLTKMPPSSVHNVSTNQLNTVCRKNQEVSRNLLQLTRENNLEDLPRDQWFFKYQDLVAFYEKNGHTNVPVMNIDLYNWIQKQKRLYSFNCRLLFPQNKINALKKMNFQFGPLEKDRVEEKAWNEMYQELSNFYRKHGHSNVPKIHPRNIKLGTWVYEQRQMQKEKKMLPSRKIYLDEIKFQWNKVHFQAVYGKKEWYSQYQELVKFFEKYKHSNVPITYKPNPLLGTWVVQQRENKKCMLLTAEQIKDLESLKFQWDNVEDKWQERYQELIQFQLQYGHTNVPNPYSANPKLGQWVNEQRLRYADSDLPAVFVDALNKLYFMWFTPHTNSNRVHATSTLTKRLHSNQTNNQNQSVVLPSCSNSGTSLHTPYFIQQNEYPKTDEYAYHYYEQNPNARILDFEEDLDEVGLIAKV